MLYKNGGYFIGKIQDGIRIEGNCKIYYETSNGIIDLEGSLSGLKFKGEVKLIDNDWK